MCDHPKSVMLFAAGFGTRMKHLTTHQPKPLIKVNGRPLIDYALDLAQAVPLETIVANLHYLPHLMEDHLAGRNVKTIIEDPDILETGGGLRNALDLLGTAPVITMNSDAIWSGPNPVQMALDNWDSDKMDTLLVCVPVSQTVGYEGAGDFTITEEGQAKRGPGAVYGGVQIIKTDLLHDVSEASFSLNLIWDKMLEKNRLYALHYPGKWCDVGHPGGITLAEDMLNV